MKERVITGVVGATVAIIALWIGGWVYTGFILLLATVAFVEYSYMQMLPWRRPQVILGLVIVWSLILTGLTRQQLIPPLPLFQDPNNLLMGMILLFLLILFSQNRFNIHQMSFLFVGALYIGYGFSFMLETMWQSNGLALTVLILFVTWSNDSVAYFFGKKVGKKKLWPSISPKKTVEGALAGMVSGVLMGAILHFLFPVYDSWMKAILLSLFIAMIGQVGDLVESAWKRSTGVKDSGKILPGHGGVLDRFDSLLFSFIILRLLSII